MKKGPIAILNRGAALFLYGDPFAKWATALPDHKGGPVTTEGLNSEPTVYLVPEYESDEEFYDWLEQNYQRLWHEFLTGWTSDESVWPEDLNLEKFVEWFPPVPSSVVYDLTDEDFILEECEA